MQCVPLTRIVEQIVGILTLRATFDLCQSVVTIVLQLNRLAASFLVMLICQASLYSRALFTNYNVFDIVADLLLSLERVEALAQLTVRILELVKQMTIIHITCLDHRLVQVFISVDNHAEFDQLGLVHWEHILDDDCFDAFDRSSSVVNLLGAHTDLFRMHKSVFNLFHGKIALLYLPCENYGLATASIGAISFACLLVLDRDSILVNHRTALLD